VKEIHVQENLVMNEWGDEIQTASRKILPAMVLERTVFHRLTHTEYMMGTAEFIQHATPHILFVVPSILIVVNWI